MAERKRKKLIIDQAVQGALLKRMVIHWLVFLGLSLILSATMHWLANPFKPPRELANDVWNYYGPFLLLMVALVPAFILDTLKLSHRFAGPIMRFRHSIQEIASGQKVHKLKFREKDFWQDFAEGFNIVIDRLEKAQKANNSSNAEAGADDSSSGADSENQPTVTIAG